MAIIPAPPAAALLAHQGGWDEILFVLAPIALFAWLLAMANRRAARDQAQRRAADAGDGDGDDPGDGDGAEAVEGHQQDI